MKRIFSYLAISLFAATFISCSEEEVLNSGKVYCNATINGLSYKDAVKLREFFGTTGIMGLDTDTRFFIESDSVGYLQFKLKDNATESSCYLVFGGIAFSSKEGFPSLGKEYTISYDSNLETDLSTFQKMVLDNHYLSKSQSGATDSEPYGVMMLYRPDINSNDGTCVSLEGTVIFENYNTKTSTYSGSFHLYKGKSENVDSSYEILGNFDVYKD